MFYSKLLLSVSRRHDSRLETLVNWFYEPGCHSQDMMWYTLLYEMIMFCKLSATGRRLMVVSLLYEVQELCNCFTLSLWVSNSCRSNSGRDDHLTTQWWGSRWWRSWCHAGDDGDHAGALEMEIKSTSWWPYHVTYDLHVMLILLCILFCLGRR